MKEDLKKTERKAEEDREKELGLSYRTSARKLLKKHFCDIRYIFRGVELSNEKWFIRIEDCRDISTLPSFLRQKEARPPVSDKSLVSRCIYFTDMKYSQDSGGMQFYTFDFFFHGFYDDGSDEKISGQKWVISGKNIIFTCRNKMMQLN